LAGQQDFMHLLSRLMLSWQSSICMVGGALDQLSYQPFLGFALQLTEQTIVALASMRRFKASPHGVLVATDVAARGLDVPGVQVRRWLSQQLS
jgi:ATP-dependent RNA helicase DDX24/MAK5